MPQLADIDAPVTYQDSDYQPWIDDRSRRIERMYRILTCWWWDYVYRLRAHGTERLPKTGAYLLVSNHSSFTDPFLHARRQGRRLRYMAKASMFENRIFAAGVKGGGGFPVRRGESDVFAMELARRLLLDGQPVVVYPEGTRYRKSLELGPAKRGAARLALETKVLVVPAATWGVKQRHLYGRNRFQRPKTVVVYGEPIDFSHLELTPENVDLVRDEVWARVHELYEEARELASKRR